MEDEPKTDPQQQRAEQLGEFADKAKLVFCLHAMPEVGSNSPPAWVGQVRSLFDPQRCDAVPVAAYSPVEPLRSQMTPVLKTILQHRDPSRNPAAEAYVKNKQWLAQPPGPELEAATRGGWRTIAASDVQLYMLLRADYLFVDLDDMVAMGTGIPIVLADLLGITCVGVGAAFVVNPWLDRYLPIRCHPDTARIRDIIWRG